MARATAKDPTRTKAKNAAVIEAVNENIHKLRDQLAQVEDLQQEGFPYRDAVRARAELQVRECIKCVFGERSPEFQQWKNYHFRTSSPSEVAETISLLQTLIAQLERKKLELQGLSLPTPAQAATSRPTLASRTSPSAAAAPVLSAATIQVQITEAPPPSPSAAMPVTMNLVPTQAASVNDRSVQPNVPAQEPTNSDDSFRSLPEKGDARHGMSPSDQAPAPQTAPSPPPPMTSHGPGVPSMPEPCEQVRDSANQGDASSAAPGPLSDPSAHLPDLSATAEYPNQSRSPDHASDRVLSAPPRPSVEPLQPSDLRSEASPPPVKVVRPPGDTLSPSDWDARVPDDPLDLVRKVCTRFHAFVRQLRLRLHDRATLDVQDEHDVHDLLYALLRYEFEEVAQTERPSGHLEAAPPAASLLPRHHIAVLTKKTKSGLGPREIAEQLTADAAAFPATAGHQTLFCFIYDPEGRIGNPRGLEAELTNVSDAQIIEVFIAPK